MAALACREEGCRDRRACGTEAEGLGHGIPVSRVGDDEVAILGGAVDDDVIDDAAVLGQHERVLRLADPHTRVIAREGVVQERAAGLSRHQELGHVRDVEQARGVAHRVVFGEVGCVAHGHQPATEVGERSTEGDMSIVERRAFRLGGSLLRFWWSGG